MQALFPLTPYADDMAKGVSKLRQLRINAGLSVRELARQINQHHTNVSFWERSGTVPRSDVLVPIAKVLGVSVEELLGQAKPKRAQPAGGRLGQVFEAVARLPRRQQQKVIEMAEGFLSLHANSH